MCVVCRAASGFALSVYSACVTILGNKRGELSQGPDEVALLALYIKLELGLVSFQKYS
jgi:hypothetical protein